MSQSNLKIKKVSSAAYVKVFIGLVILTALTILQPIFMHMNYGPTFIVQLSIAFIKISLVVMYYMHIKGSPLVYKQMIFGVLLLLVVLSAFVSIDTYARVFNNDIFSN